MSFDAIKSFATSDFSKNVLFPTVAGVGTAFALHKMQPKVKQPEPQKPMELPEIPAIEFPVIEPPEIPSLPSPPEPQRPGGRTAEETAAMRAERRRLRKGAGRASTILVGMPGEEEEEELRKNVKKKTLLGSA